MIYERKKRRRLDAAAKEGGRGFHSWAYHRHFEDYDEYETVDAKGRVRIKRVYAGTVYRLELTRAAAVKLRLAMFALWLLAAAAFGYGAVRPGEVNTLWYVVLGEVGSIAGLAWTLFGFAGCLLAKEEMTVSDYNGSAGNLRRGSGTAAVFLALTGFVILARLLFELDDALNELLCAGCMFASALCCLVINRLELNAPYSERPSEAVSPRESVRID